MTAVKENTLPSPSISIITICGRPPFTVSIRTFLKSYIRSAQIQGVRSTGRKYLARWHSTFRRLMSTIVDVPHR